jgi:hypothetical protein
VGQDGEERGQGDGGEERTRDQLWEQEAGGKSGLRNEWCPFVVKWDAVKWK